jgi:hypothetical protein
MESAFDLKKIADAYNQRIEQEKLDKYLNGKLADNLFEAASEGKYFTKIKVPDEISFPAVEYALKLKGYVITLSDPMSRNLRVEWRGKE